MITAGVNVAYVNWLGAKVTLEFIKFIILYKYCYIPLESQNKAVTLLTVIILIFKQKFPVFWRTPLTYKTWQVWRLSLIAFPHLSIISYSWWHLPTPLTGITIQRESFLPYSYNVYLPSQWVLSSSCLWFSLPPTKPHLAYVFPTFFSQRVGLQLYFDDSCYLIIIFVSFTKNVIIFVNF